MVLKPSREAACPGSFAKKIWKSKQPLSHWPYNQVSKSFFFLSFFILEKICSCYKRRSIRTWMDPWTEIRILGSSPDFALDGSYPDLPVDLSFPICFFKLFNCKIILGAQSLSLLASSNLCFLATEHSRSQVPEIWLSLWNSACWAYSPQQLIYTDRPQMSVLMTDLSSHCLWIFLVTSQS